MCQIASCAFLSEAALKVVCKVFEIILHRFQPSANLSLLQIVLHVVCQPVGTKAFTTILAPKFAKGKLPNGH